MRRAARLLLSLFIPMAMAILVVSEAEAQSRVALVVGNGSYRSVTALDNPPKDAADVAAALQRLSFSVTRVDNANFDAMRRALLDFGRRAAGAEIAIVFYAGHGMEIGGDNWLIPVDAELKTDIGVDQEAIGLKSVMLAVSNASKLGLVMLDACRNNPFAAKMQRSIRTRSVDRGLTRVEPSGSVLVAFAAKDGTVAADGIGRNSPFTAALLRHIETPGLEVSFLFRNVRDEVMTATRRDQEPFVYGSLSKDPIYLNVGQPLAGVSTPPQQLSGPQVSVLTSPAIAPAPPPPLVATIGGQWSGTYSYANGNKVGFSFVFDQGGQCRGRSEEPNTFGNKSAAKLFADLACQSAQLRPGQEIKIIKKYDGTGGVSHAVSYTGVVSSDMNQISGHWTIGNTRGAFVLRRN